MSFLNKVVIVTGAGSGIGAATAILFAQEGADVVMVGRNETALKEIAEKCKQNSKDPLVIKADVSTDNETRNIVKETIDKYGRIDVLVNNAGISNRGSILDDKLMENYDILMGINLRAAVHLTNLAAPYLVESEGNVVNISSVAGTAIIRKALSYCVSKAGLDQFTRCAALELAPFGVRVNAVGAGPVRTNIWKIDGSTTFTWKKLEALTALGNISEPEEIADLVVFLASDTAKSITGSVVVSDSGFLLK